MHKPTTEVVMAVRTFKLRSKAKRRILEKGSPIIITIRKTTAILFGVSGSDFSRIKSTADGNTDQ
jgi:hypothetical protein